MLYYVPLNKRGFRPQSPHEEIVNGILCKLKTGVQWSLLPVKALLSDFIISWQSVYYHYRKWCKTDVWKQSWTKILHKYSLLDLSGSDLDGSHTRAIRGGEQTGYQKRKKSKIINALYLTARQGLLLAMSGPVSGNYHALFDIETHFDEPANPLSATGISVEALFLNRFDTSVSSWKGFNYLWFLS